jgi:hypothetical protein
MTDDFFGQDLSLPALAGERDDESRYRQIRDARFVDCELRGPAIVHAGPGFLLASAAHFDLRQEDALRPLAPDQTIPDDAIVVDDCFLDGCRFHGLRFTGDGGQLSYLFQHCTFGPDRLPFALA